MRGLKLSDGISAVTGWRRTLPGVRGLKCVSVGVVKSLVRRTLPGVRGLKFGVGNYNAIGYTVAPYPGCVD